MRMKKTWKNIMMKMLAENLMNLVEDENDAEYRSLYLDCLLGLMHVAKINS